MIKKINRIFQDFLREKRLKIGKFIWDRKEKTPIKLVPNFIEENNINSILFLRYDGKIGDMVVNTFMFREIKKVYPHIKIAVVARGEAKNIIINNPNVDKIYDYKKDRKSIKKLATEIKNKKFDLLIDFSEMLRVNQMMFINLCSAKINMGLDKENWNLFDISINSGSDFEWSDHITNRYISYLRKLGFKNQIDTSYDIKVNFTDKFEIFLKKIKENKIVLLNPYGASKHKSFSIETLKKIITFLKNLNLAVICIYYADKYQDIEFLEKENDNVYIPQNINTINDTIYLVSKSNLIITPDTSIVHIASALNKKIIAIYPPKGGKYGVDHLVWSPQSNDNRVIFCQDKRDNFDEIDVNTFNLEELKYILEVNKNDL